tara:strand:+ start:322 stop:1167 length:846 start_codon:yes stop_codon:yes gene_type:complete
MAINFPVTSGQPTDGSYTYTVAGISYSWNGESWVAAGAGASATDRTLFSVSTNAASATPALSYNNNSGVFSYTPPDLSGFLTSETDPVFSASDAANVTNTKINNWDTAYGWGNHASGGYLTSLGSVSGHTDVTISSPQVNQVLEYNGSAWVNTTNSAGLQSRTTVSATNSIAANGIANISMTTPKTYALLSIETSHAAWVTLYSDTTSRTADSSRNETTDPVAGSGVLAEVITGGAATQLITPASVCFNSAGASTTYLKIVNKSGSTANVQVTLTYVALEG